MLQPDVLALVADAERNVPFVKTWDSFGHRQDALVTSAGWRQLTALGIREGIVAIAYENRYGASSRVYQFLKYLLWSPSSALVTCPSAMTDGAARLLARRLAAGGDGNGNGDDDETRRVFQSAYERLTSRDPAVAWTSGQWMTERTGGSDVRNTETRAVYAPGFAPEDSVLDADGQRLGPWSISGFKWFSSATDSQMTVLLAKTADGALSAFFAPTRRRLWRRPASVEPASNDSREAAECTELNGLQIQRLKTKLGTRSLPTAELVLSNMRAYLLGPPGAGVKEISTVLNITRVHNAVSAVAGWGRGLAISRAFARVRTVGGRLLMDLPAHVRTLAHQHVEYRAMLHLTYFVVTLLGVSESGSSSGCLSRTTSSEAWGPPQHLAIQSETGTNTAASHLLRLSTPLAKAVTARAAIAGLAECMESLGGVGYLENDDPELNIARLYRDVNVLSIWEGTTNVMADDLVRVLKGRDGSLVLLSLQEWVERALHLAEEAASALASTPASTSAETTATPAMAVPRQQIESAAAALISHIRSESPDSLRLNGRALLSRLAWVVCAVLLCADAARDGDTVAGEVLSRWLERRTRSLYGFCVADDLLQSDSSSSTDWDRRLVFGQSGRGSGSPLSKL